MENYRHSGACLKARITVSQRAIRKLPDLRAQPPLHSGWGGVAFEYTGLLFQVSLATRKVRAFCFRAGLFCLHLPYGRLSATKQAEGPQTLGTQGLHPNYLTAWEEGELSGGEKLPDSCRSCLAPAPRPHPFLAIPSPAVPAAAIPAQLPWTLTDKPHLLPTTLPLGAAFTKTGCALCGHVVPESRQTPGDQLLPLAQKAAHFVLQGVLWL